MEWVLAGVGIFVLFTGYRLWKMRGKFRSEYQRAFTDVLGQMDKKNK